jgi:archaellum biogenesis protein FlaJ (TadC family)
MQQKSAKSKVQRLEPKSKFKDIFNSWLWSLSLVLHFTLYTLILFSHELLTFYILHYIQSASWRTESSP